MIEQFPQEQIFIPSILKIGEDKLLKLGLYLKNFKDVAVFYSEGIDKIFGQKIEQSLNKENVNILYKESIDKTEIENIVHSAFNIPKKAKVLVGIGGGKALDYAKYCAHTLSIPFISVPTSLSNDGFCSPVASLMSNGKRKTIKAQIPYGVIIDTNAVKTCPVNCIFSGIGDLISKVTAGCDWKLAHKKKNEKVHDFSYLMSQNTVTDILNYQKSDITSNEFINHLAIALLMNGLSMEVASSSRPASGSEHLISHALDKHGKTHRMHGIQVGVATYLCSYLQDNDFEKVKSFLENTGFIEYLTQYPLNKDDFINAVKKAPTIKEDFYTILSQKENINKALKFVEEDETMQKVLR